MFRISWFSFFLLANIFIAGSCKKDTPPTVVKGKVIDIKTGKPVKDANIEFGITKEVNGLDQYLTQTTLPTDANGEFICVLESEYYAIIISKDGYASKYPHLDIIPGQTNSIEVNLVPRDGFLKLKIKNDTGLHDTIYTSIFSRILVTEARLNTYDVTKEFPLVLYKDEIYNQLFLLPSPEVVQIRWKFNNPDFKVGPLTIDSIMVVPNDTITYLLSYQYILYCSETLILMKD